MSQPKGSVTGRLPAEAIRVTDIPRLPAPTIAAFRDLEDLTGTVSDAMDDLGLAGAIPASTLIPGSPGLRLVGQAVTVRNVEAQSSVLKKSQERTNRMGEQDAYALAEEGDVIVIEGIFGASNMGGQSATLAHREGCSGAIIDGSYRDPDASRKLGFPIWAKGVTPVTGKWRIDTAEINGRVRIAGISVTPGDLVLADDAGVVFVPFGQVGAVLAIAQKIDSADKRRKDDIDAGVDFATVVQTRYK